PGATLIAYAALIPLHLSTLGLEPAQAYLVWRALRSGHRRAIALSALAGAVVLWGTTRLVGGRPMTLAETSLAGLGRYTAPYFDTEGPRHAFGLLDISHLLAVANDVMLAAPLALVALPAWWLARRRRLDEVQSFLGLAALGCLAINFVFSRELGAYRDWDILAPYGFVLLAFTGSLVVRPHPGSLRVSLLLVVVGGLYHTVPWVLGNVRPGTAIAHLRLALTAPAQWSPFARGYIHESLAIYYRERGDEETSLHEYEAAVEANPVDARHHVGLGNRYFSRGELQAAAREYAHAVERRPGYAPAHNNLAFVLVQIGAELDRARSHAETAVRLEPENADFWLTLARVELATQRREEARRALREALRHRLPFPEAEELLESAGKRDRLER
ncbi:MAG: tetratricopeptide repeat protein, partial [Candidatus Krumholzibacteriia bacterium]